ncbi:MAG: lipid kinase [Bacteroidaceae bacterium]|nr:lipid kinase [Bacteroidaceae bacterium]
MSRWGIVVGAQSYKSRKRWAQMQTYLDARGVTYDSVQSDVAGSVERLTRMLCTQGYKTVVLVGGDGVLNDALNGIMAAEPLSDDFAFGVIPCGISNDFASFWDITADDYQQAIDNIIERRTRLIDVGQCDYTNADGQYFTRYFLNCVNIGLGAKLVELTNHWHRLIGSKRLSLLPVFIGNIFQRKSFQIAMRTDCETLTQEIMSVCIGNTTGFGQTPNAVPYNGLLDMSVITRPTVWQLLRGFWLLGKGKFLNYSNVHPSRIRHIDLLDLGRASVSLDGRQFSDPPVTPVHITVRPDAIRFIISKD